MPETHEKFFYTAINQADNKELRIEFMLHGPDTTKGKADSVTFWFPKCIRLSNTQLGELGALFTHMAGKVDQDDVDELIDGYWGA